MSHTSRSPWLTIGLGSLAVVLATTAVLHRAPSYQAGTGFRTNPPGSDFLQEWVGGRIVWEGNANQLYDWDYSRQQQHDLQRNGFEWPADEYYPMVYPPFYYALVAPLAQFDCWTAARWWCLANGIAYGLAFALLATDCLQFTPQARWFPLLAILYGPVLLSLNMGQKSGFILLLFVGTFVLYARRRSGWAGVVFGGLLFKPHLTLVILAALALRRDWRFLAGFAVSGCLALAGSLCVGWKPCSEFLAVALSAGRYMEHGGYPWEHAHNLWCGIRGLFPEKAGRWAAMAYGLLAALLIGVVWRMPERDAPSNSLERGEWFGLLVVLTVLLSPHFFTYDLGLLILPLALVACRILAAARGLVPGESAAARRSDSSAILALLATLIFVVSTWLPAVAVWTGVQWSCWILTLWLVVWAGARTGGTGGGGRQSPVRGARMGVLPGVSEPIC